MPYGEKRPLFADPEPVAVRRAVRLKPSQPSQHSNGSYPRGSQAGGWHDAEGSRASGSGEDEWLDSECGLGQDFEVVAGRRVLGYRYMIR